MGYCFRFRSGQVRSGKVRVFNVHVHSKLVSGTGSFRLAARVILYASSHRQDNTYHGLCYTSRGALAGTRNSSMGPQRRIYPTTHRTISERSYHGVLSNVHNYIKEVTQNLDQYIFKRSDSYLSGPLPHVARFKTVNKMC